VFPAEQLVALVRLAAVVLAMLAVSGGSSAAARIEVTASPHRVQIGHPPYGRAGDQERVRWALSDRYGRRIGVGLLRCQWYHTFERVCAGVLTVGSGARYGTLAVQGVSQTRALGVWAVTGGTGVYQGYNGELRFVATGFGKLTVVITT